MPLDRSPRSGRPGREAAGAGARRWLSETLGTLARPIKSHNTPARTGASSWPTVIEEVEDGWLEFSGDPSANFEDHTQETLAV